MKGRGVSLRLSAERFLVASLLFTLVLALGWGRFGTKPVYGAQLGDRTLQLGLADAGATTNYSLAFDVTTHSLIGSIDVQFCSNDPLPGTPCTVPAGLDVSKASLDSQSGQTGFSISNASTANELILSRIPVLSAPGRVNYQFSNIVNPSSIGTYFVRLQTYTSSDASGSAIDYGGIAFAITNGVGITAEVPPYLIFCTGVTISNLDCSQAVGDYIDFGELSPTKASSGSSQMLVGTNALNGYNISVDGTTMTSGVNTISAVATGDVSRPGTGQFGFNLRANNTPPGGSDPSGPGTGQPASNYNQPNIFQFNSGDTLVTTTAPDNLRLFTASYLINVPANQAPGIYVSTLTYICLASF